MYTETENKNKKRGFIYLRTPTRSRAENGRRVGRLFCLEEF